MFEICLAIYLLIGFAFAYGLEVENDRKLLVAKPFAGILVVVFWPVFVVMLIPKIKNFKFRGKTIWERKS